MKTTLKVVVVTKHGRRRFMVDMRGSGGGRKFFDVRAVAKRFQKKKQKELARIGAAAHDWAEADRAEFAVARQLLAGASMIEAARYYAERQLVGDGKMMDEALRLCIEEKEKADRVDAYTKKLRYVLGPLCVAVKKKCHEVEPRDIVAWLEGTGWAITTRQEALVTTSTFFNYCKRKGWVKSNPCADVEPFPDDEKPPGILTVDECARLMESAGKTPDALGYFALALFAGLRPVEINGRKPNKNRPQQVSGIEWEHVNLEQSYVEVPANAAKANSRRRRIVRLEPNAVAWLAIAGRDALKLPRPLFESVRTEAKVRWSHDCLRHSYASYHLAAFGSADKTATEMGHHNTTMLFRHYRELVRPEEAKKFWALMP